MGTWIKSLLALTLGTTGVILLLCARVEEWTLQPLAFSLNTGLQPPPFRHRCSDVIKNMLIGHWEDNNVTRKERLHMFNYYDQVVKGRGVPYGIQRPDGVCGNMTHGWYKALCHPGGPTPCCYGFRCINASVQHCTCEDCFDLRTQIEADFATWRAQNEACQPRKMAVAEICSLLGNASVYFIGDSLVRHLYMAFAMLAKGTDDKVFHYTNMPAELSSLCRGRLLFAHTKCRPVVLHSPILCGGRLKTKFNELRNTGFRKKIVAEILSLGNVSRSLVVFGFGVDDRYNVNRLQQLWNALLQEMKLKRLRTPYLVWTTPHIVGPLRGVSKKYRPEFHQDLPHIRNYTQEMIKFLTKRGVPVLSSYNITMGVMSHDGFHHGMGVNKLRAQVLLHHIEELTLRGQW